jgi:hypothetical protein
MLVQRLQDFVDHPLTKWVDVAALTTSAASAASYVYPDFRAAVHEWGIIFTDLAPIAAFFWLIVQIVCKIVLTVMTVFSSKDEDKDDE